MKIPLSTTQGLDTAKRIGREVSIYYWGEEIRRPAVRVNYWRCGIHDVDYLMLATEIDPERTGQPSTASSPRSAVSRPP